MQNGFYAARVADDSVRSVHVDEDTVYYLQTARLFKKPGRCPECRTGEGSSGTEENRSSG